MSDLNWTTPLLLVINNISYCGILNFVITLAFKQSLNRKLFFIKFGEMVVICLLNLLNCMCYIEEFYYYYIISYLTVLPRNRVIAKLCIEGTSSIEKIRFKIFLKLYCVCTLSDGNR